MSPDPKHGSSSASKGKDKKRPDEMDTDTDDDTAQLKAEIKNLRHQLLELGKMQQQQAQAYQAQLGELDALARSAMKGKDPGEVLKPKAPGPFSGAAGTLQPFLTQLRAYFMYFPVQFKNEETKVHFAAGCLSGPALAWFEPTLRDYVGNAVTGTCKLETARIFGNYHEFEKAIHQTFGTVDEERDAENKLNNLRQRGSASEYASAFRQIVSKLPWEQSHLMAAFYQGLREEVKDEIYKESRPDTLAEYIGMAVRIDDRQYKRRQERKGGNKGWNNNFKRYPNQKKKRDEPIAYGHTLNPGRMELDATKPGNNKKNGKCYNCGKTGHFANKCRAPKKEWKPAPEGKKQVNATDKQELEHKNLNWTACYDDGCYTHLSDKEGSGWFPKQPKKRTIAMIKKQTIQMPDLARPRTDKEARTEVRGLLQHLVQQDLDNQETLDRQPGNKKTLAMTGRQPRKPKISDLFKGESSVKPKNESSSWNKGAKEQRKSRKERQEVYKREERANDELQSHLVERCKELRKQREVSPEIPDRQPEDDGVIIDNTEDDSSFKIRCVDDDYELVETSSSSESTDSKENEKTTNKRTEVPTLRRENATIGQTPSESEEEDEPDYVTPTQLQAIQRHFPVPGGEDNAIAILAVDFKTATTMGEPEEESGDDPRLKPTHEGHVRIAWASCAYTTCETHFRTKARLNAFPIRKTGYAIPLPYLQKELIEWRVTIRQSDQVMIIEPDPSTPMDCRKKPTYGEVCGSDTCQIHMYQKAYEWHKYVTTGSQPEENRNLISTPSCETQDHMTCHVPNCPDHLLDKAREWHKWQIGTPKSYRQARRSLEVYELEDPMGSRQSQLDNEAQLDKWYHLQKTKRECKWKYAVNCKNSHCNQHTDMKEQIYKRLCNMFEDGFCFKHPLDGTGPTEWYKEVKRQIEEETIPAKNEARHL